MKGAPSEVTRAAVKDAKRSGGVGYRKLERNVGLKKWALKGVMDKRSPQVPSVDYAATFCQALGLEFYIGPLHEWPETENNAKFLRDNKGRYSSESQKSEADQAPAWKISDENLWALICAFADEWQSADEAGKENLEIRFVAQFPELVKG